MTAPEDNIAYLPDRLERAAKLIREGAALYGKGREQLMDGLMKICAGAAAAREANQSDQAFGAWWDAQDFRRINGKPFNEHERAAAVAMGSNPGRLHEILSQTSRISLLEIYRHEWRFEDSSKPRRGRKSNRKLSEDTIQAKVRDWALARFAKGQSATRGEAMREFGIGEHPAQLGVAEAKAFWAGREAQAEKVAETTEEENLAAAKEKFSEKSKITLSEAIRIAKAKLHKSFEQTVNAEVRKRIATADDAVRKHLTEARKEIEFLRRNARSKGVFTKAEFRQLQMCCHPDTSASPETKAKLLQILVENEARLLKE